MPLDLKDRMTAIDVNLDDLQSGVEASSRAADALHTDAAGFDKILKRFKNVPLIGSLVRRAVELQTCARDQRAALRELREAITRLQKELTRSNSAVRPPPASAADRSRR